MTSSGRKSTLDQYKEVLEEIKENREENKKLRELKKQGINPSKDGEIKERGVREKSTDNGDVERTATSHSPLTRTAAYQSQEGTIIFGRKYVKGEKSSRIRLLLFILLMAAVIAFFIIMGILGSQQQ